MALFAMVLKSFLRLDVQRATLSVFASVLYSVSSSGQTMASSMVFAMVWKFFLWLDV